MNKKLVFILSMMASPLAAMEKPTLEKYLNDQEYEDNWHIRNKICGVEMIVLNKKNSMPQGYILACPQADALLTSLLQRSDKADYSISSIKMEKWMGGEFKMKDEKYNISIDEAKTALALFSNIIQPTIALFKEKAKQEHIQEYERKYGPVEKK
jgi:hypothetical protein